MHARFLTTPQFFLADRAELSQLSLGLTHCENVRMFCFSDHGRTGSFRPRSRNTGSGKSCRSASKMVERNIALLTACPQGRFQDEKTATSRSLATLASQGAAEPKQH
jgi:hypothetical protein